MAKRANTRPAGRVMFTGGSGKAGKHVVQYLVDSGYQVLNIDTKPLDNPNVRTLITDITDSGQVFNALSSYMGLHEFDPSLRPQQVDAVVHFAAIPRIMITPDNEVFRVNALGTYNVVEAATKLGIRKIIVASSETTYGLVFANEPKDPDYLPLDEEYDVNPMDSYALSKIVNEQTARVAVPAGDGAHVQAQALVGIRLRDVDQRCADLDVDAEFFVEFARERRFGRFAGLVLAAGEFPQPGELLALGPLRDQHAPVGIDEHAGNDQLNPHPRRQSGARGPPSSRSSSSSS